MDGLSGKGRAIFSLEATSTLGGGGAVGLATFSGDGSAIFSIGFGSDEGTGGGVTVSEGFAGWATVIFSLEATSG
jgi:hypothetical protein